MSVEHPAGGGGTGLSDEDCALSIAATPSIVYLPDTRPYPALLDFFATRFPRIPVETWVRRIAAGQVLTEDGQPVTLTTPYLPDRRLFYHREVAEEPVIPFAEHILFQDDRLLVACKPHFLPVTASGPYVRETLLERLKAATGNPQLSPINRIDRETAGLVLLSTDRTSRGAYQRLFMTEGLVRKTYEAIVALSPGWQQSDWLAERLVANRIEQGDPWFRMQCSTGPVNARTRLRLIEADGRRARFALFPLTGKKHQLRLHLAGLGLPIVHDRIYPKLQAKSPDDFARPLQLLSRRIEFCDPFSGAALVFTSPRRLTLSGPRE